MSTDVVCLDGVDPYLINSNAREVGSQSQVEYEGRLYTKIFYELKITVLKRVINIIKVVAIAIISCFIALAFQQVRKLWTEGTKGFEKINVLLPVQALFQGIQEARDVERYIISWLNGRDALALCTTSTHNQVNAQAELIGRLKAEIRAKELDINILNREAINVVLNLGTQACSDLGTQRELLVNRKQISDELQIGTLINMGFFGKKPINHLDLKNFSNIQDNDIKQISELCPNLVRLSLTKANVTVNAGIHLAKIASFKSLSLCQFKNFSILEQLPNLENISISEYWKGDDEEFSFLQRCPNLHSLTLSNCYFFKDFSFLKHCPNLRSLNLFDCNYIREINEISISENCKNLKKVNFSGSLQFMDMDCQALRARGIKVFGDKVEIRSSARKFHKQLEKESSEAGTTSRWYS